MLDLLDVYIFSPRCQTVPAAADGVSARQQHSDTPRSSRLQLQIQTSATSSSTAFYYWQPDIKGPVPNARVNAETVENETVREDSHESDSLSDHEKVVHSTEAVSSEDLEIETTVSHGQADEELEDNATDILADSEHPVETSESLSPTGGHRRPRRTSPSTELPCFIFPLNFSEINTCPDPNRSTPEETDKMCTSTVIARREFERDMTMFVT